MKFRIVTKPDCRYCTLAKNALNARGLVYVEEALKPEEFAAFKAQGFDTVPQIWVHGTITRNIKHIGGYMELMDYLNSRKLPSASQTLSAIK